jgi:hypothetical protein
MHRSDLKAILEVALFSSMIADTNPKLEFRNPKQTRNPKAENDYESALLDAVFSSFGFRVCFGFRNSDFEFAALLAFRQRGVAKRNRAADSFREILPIYCEIG